MARARAYAYACIYVLGAGAPPSMKTPHHRGTRMKDPEELQRPRRPCTRDLRAILCFGARGVDVKPQHVRKSPMNENLLALGGFAASLCYGLGIEVSKIRR